MVTKEEVMGALNKCFDPEMPMVSLVELGLIYDVIVKDEIVDIKMTLTTPGCGMAPMISNDAKTKVEELDGVSEAIVELVWDPPWTPDLIHESARKKLGYA